jgi:hypothetical protein
MIAVPAVQAWPRSTPARSAQAIAMWLMRAVAMAIVTSPGRSPAGVSMSGQLVGTSSSSAPARATVRVSSGNSRS